jgi:C4-dicarboxylate-specific signal transduction histidine kinase
MTSANHTSSITVVVATEYRDQARNLGGAPRQFAARPECRVEERTADLQRANGKQKETEASLRCDERELQSLAVLFVNTIAR